jgi:hypothetical protein
MAGRLEFLRSGVISEGSIKRILLLELDYKQKGSRQFCIGIEGIGYTFMNLHFLCLTSDKHPYRMGYSEHTPDELHSRGWQDCLELIPTADVTMRSLCQDIYRRDLDYHHPQDAPWNATREATDAISQWT